jgi:hypothetical protein
MGRPLKIAKSVGLVLGNTYAANNRADVGTTSNLVRNMPFVIATTTGNLTAGQTYYVLNVVDSAHITVSATDLSANPSLTEQVLTNAGPVTVNLTAAAVDTGFNNPAGSANTYSVVGGNTSQYANTIAANVAIGIVGSGIIVTDSGSADIFGANSDFANTAVGAAISANGVHLGFASSNTQNTLAITDTVETGSFVVTSGNALADFTEAKPVVFSDPIGGIEAGTVYYVSNIANATHFTITTAPGFSTYPVVDETASSNATQDILTLAANASTTFATGTTWEYANDEVGFIVRQKGKSKFLVKGGTTGLVGVCTTANLAASALTANTMRIVATYANAATNLVQTLSDKNSQLFGTGDTLANSEAVYATFNTGAAANASPGQVYPVVVITNS